MEKQTDYFNDSPKHCRTSLKLRFSRSAIFMFLFIAFIVAGSGHDAFGQQKSVTGTIIDMQGQTIVGTTIVVKGTTIGTISDANGKYSLTNVEPNAILIYSFIGMKTQEIAVNKRSIIDVTMVDEAEGIDEVVVVGYGTQTKKTLTGAVSSVNNASLTRTKTAMTSNALVGKVAGITSRITDGRPGASTTLSIRNYGTPLYIIDGVPTKRPNVMQSIDPTSIKSIQVLKDASAASVYGARASNGVVIITTKEGSNRLQVDINTSIAMQNYSLMNKVDM